MGELPKQKYGFIIAWGLLIRYRFNYYRILQNTIEYCVSILDKVIPDLGEQQFKKVAFLNEQLKLSITNKNGRLYSSDLFACSALWKNTSPALCNQIHEEGLLTLPSPNHLN